MKKKCKFCLSGILCLMAFLISMNGLRRKEEALAARIAPEILRFHVLANSDSKKDQALKLEVKDLLLEKIREEAGAETAASKELLCSYIHENKTQLEETAEEYMREQGFDYTADIRLERCLFPEKTYGDMTFPAGTYDAVRVLLGSGQGKNFWCVLYPSLCYADSVHAVVPEESKEQLKALIPEDDFAALMRTRRPVLFAAGRGGAEQGTAMAGQRCVAQSAGTATQKNAEQESAPLRVKVRFKLADLLAR